MRFTLTLLLLAALWGLLAASQRLLHEGDDPDFYLDYEELVAGASEKMVQMIPKRPVVYFPQTPEGAPNEHYVDEDAVGTASSEFVSEETLTAAADLFETLEQPYYEDFNDAWTEHEVVHRDKGRRVSSDEPLGDDDTESEDILLTGENPAEEQAIEYDEEVGAGQAEDDPSLFADMMTGPSLSKSQIEKLVDKMFSDELKDEGETAVGQITDLDETVFAYDPIEFTEGQREQALATGNDQLVEAYFDMYDEVHATERAETAVGAPFQAITQSTCEEAGMDSIKTLNDCKKALTAMQKSGTCTQKSSKTMYNGCFTAHMSDSSYYVYDAPSRKHRMSDPKSKVLAGTQPRKTASTGLFTYYCHKNQEAVAEVQPVGLQQRNPKRFRKRKHSSSTLFSDTVLDRLVTDVFGWRAIRKRKQHQKKRLARYPHAETSVGFWDLTEEEVGAVWDYLEMASDAVAVGALEKYVQDSDAEAAVGVQGKTKGPESLADILRDYITLFHEAPL